MNWTETGVVLSSKFYSESARMVTVFNRSVGKTSALLKNTKLSVQIGDIARVSWRGRSQESLGTFTIEPLSSPFIFAMNNPLKIYAIESACALCILGLPEKAPHEKLFDVLRRFLLSLTQNEWLQNYVFFELTFLAEIGFGLNLSSCTVTGRRDIYYISPKTGHGVVKEIGDPYKEKLFVIPKFLLDENPIPTYEDIFLSLQITKHFLKTYFCDISGKKLPLFRECLVKSICNKVQGE